MTNKMKRLMLTAGFLTALTTTMIMYSGKRICFIGSSIIHV